MPMMWWRFREDPCALEGSCELTEAQLEAMGEHLPVGEDGAFIARYQWIDRDGVHIRFDGRTMRYVPERWTCFWAEQVDDSPNQAFGETCAVLLAVFQLWDWDRRARDGIQEVERGEIGFRQLLTRDPDLETHPEIQREIVRHVRDGSTPPEKRGRRPTVAPGERELCHWAAWYLWREVGTLREACERAVDQHFEHLPASWNPSNAPDTLERKIRNLAKLPFILSEPDE